MLDDCPVVNNYDKLSAQFHVVRSGLIEMVGFRSFFMIRSRTIIIVCLNYMLFFRLKSLRIIITNDNPY